MYYRGILFDHYLVWVLCSLESRAPIPNVQPYHSGPPSALWSDRLDSSRILTRLFPFFVVILPNIALYCRSSMRHDHYDSANNHRWDFMILFLGVISFASLFFISLLLDINYSDVTQPHRSCIKSPTGSAVTTAYDFSLGIATMCVFALGILLHRNLNSSFFRPVAVSFPIQSCESF